VLSFPQAEPKTIYAMISDTVHSFGHAVTHANVKRAQTHTSMMRSSKRRKERRSRFARQVGRLLRSSICIYAMAGSPSGARREENSEQTISDAAAAAAAPSQYLEAAAKIIACTSKKLMTRTLESGRGKHRNGRLTRSQARARGIHNSHRPFCNFRFHRLASRYTLSIFISNHTRSMRKGKPPQSLLSRPQSQLAETAAGREATSSLPRRGVART